MNPKKTSLSCFSLFILMVVGSVGNLSAQSEQIDNRLIELESALLELQAANSQLRMQVEALEEEVTTLSKQVEQRGTTISELDSTTFAELLQSILDSATMQGTPVLDPCIRAEMLQRNIDAITTEEFSEVDLLILQEIIKVWFDIEQLQRFSTELSDIGLPREARLARVTTSQIILPGDRETDTIVFTKDRSDPVVAIKVPRRDEEMYISLDQDHLGLGWSNSNGEGGIGVLEDGPFFRQYDPVSKTSLIFVPHIWGDSELDVERQMTINFVDRFDRAYRILPEPAPHKMGR